MKKITLLFLLMISAAISAQAPAGYYDGAAGLSGPALKTKLSQIISAGHQDHGYNGLWEGYKTTDIDHFYENDGTVLDMYSENPAGKDPYNFSPGKKQCGNYGAEGDCYNREHVVPQSLFDEKSPMRNDINFIRATDGKVNGMRSNYPFGTNRGESFTSQNGSKVGKSTAEGYGGTAFEPIDEFKGDIARMVLYFVTRYETQLPSFHDGNMLGGSAFPGLQKWELDVMLSWAKKDPVSKSEIERNNAAYAYQGNRNPFIDHPEYVEAIWGAPVADDVPPSAATDLSAGNATQNSVALSWTAATDNIGIASYDIYRDGSLASSVSGTETTAIISGLAPKTSYSFFIIAKDAAGNASPQSNTATATTLDGPVTPPTTGSCVTETFDNIPASESNYKTRSWTSNNLSWTATDARTDLKINGSAITIRKGAVSASASPKGIGSLTVTTQLQYTGTAGNLILKVNGNKVGEIPYGATVQTTSIKDINIAGNVAISIENSNENRISIDDLSWSCYSAPLSTNETSAKDGFRVYPNPASGGVIRLSGLAEKAYVEIYSTTGQRLFGISNVENNQDVKLPNLPKGIYILKAGAKTAKLIIP